jgi:hypothetical protein
VGGEQLTKADREATGVFTERYRRWLDEAAATFKDPARVRAELDALLTRLRKEESP